MVYYDLYGKIAWIVFYVRGGLGCWGCCGSGGCRGVSNIVGVSSLFSDMYCVLSVRACECLLHGIGQFGLQLGWQKSFSAICNAFFISFVEVV